MSTNIKVAIATGDAVLTYVDDDTTVGSNGTADANLPSTTRIIAIHALATAAGSYSIKGQRQITNKTAEGTAIKFQVAANEASDIYIGELGVAVFGVVSVSGPTDGCVLTAMLG
jgi:hypothetical protein|tara:strand:- start:296 stop:637 length:342 start_codon:yes stop_codon:yes gene_type:complete